MFLAFICWTAGAFALSAGLSIIYTWHKLAFTELTQEERDGGFHLLAIMFFFFVLALFVFGIAWARLG